MQAAVTTSSDSSKNSSFSVNKDCESWVVLHGNKEGLAADVEHNGNMIRRAVDYFCHLAVKPEFYSQMVKDEEFNNSVYANKIKWLANDFEDIYDPDYADMLRVSFMLRFDRGRLADLVSLLSGRDFETKEFKDEIVEDSYNRLNEGILSFINEYDFKQFVLAIKGAGFINSKLLNSQMTLDFCYYLYLKLKEDESISNTSIKRYVQKWFVLSTLTGRYVGSPESVMSRDIRLINERGFVAFLELTEESVLSEAFWNVTLPQNLDTSVASSPAFHVFVAAQINKNCNSLFLNGTKVSDLISIAGDVHHIFPKAYLKKNGVTLKNQYNQIANYIYLDTQVNKAVSDDSPNKYFGRVIAQCESGVIDIGNINNKEALFVNMKENCIPESIVNMTVEDYSIFLDERRKLMSKFIMEYYENL